MILMNRKWVFWSIALAGVFVVLGCFGLRFSQPERNPQTVPAEITAVATTRVPLQTPGDYPKDCYYNWAYRSLPELSKQVQSAVGELYPEVEAHAQAYGEDCIYADGHADFIALETDFFVTLKVADLNDDAEAGNMIRRTTDLLLARFPIGETPGPQPGRITYRFNSAGKERNLSFATADFLKMPPGLTGADLMRALIR